MSTMDGVESSAEDCDVLSLYQGAILSRAGTSKFRTRKDRRRWGALEVPDHFHSTFGSQIESCIHSNLLERAFLKQRDESCFVYDGNA